MKTIGFYSYKGGTGKSLMAANLAVCLSRLGKNCVLVDCDVEGPSLHNKFYHVGRIAIGRGGGDVAGGGGLVGLIAAHLKPQDWDGTSIDKLKPSLVQNAQPFIYQLPAPSVRWANTQSEQMGAIHLLPAGNIYSDEYWAVVWSPVWRDIFTLYDKVLNNKIGRPAFQKILDFLLSIKTALSRLTPAPDYMLVDLRAGASELATTLINAWIDKVVYCFSFNEDNIQYLGDTFFKIENAASEREHIPETLRPLLVLSRVPTGIDYYRGDRDLRSAIDAMRIKWDEIHILHSDRDLELQEELRLGYRADPQNRRLTNEYLKVFEALIDENRPGAEGRTGWLKTAIGLSGEASEEKDRVFNWEPEVGALINPNDDSRNVSFKVQTFQVLLEGLASGISELLLQTPAADEGKSDDNKKAKSALERLLDLAGLHCGEKFGDALISKWSTQKISVEDRITKWCEFDSDVGFGKFELVPDTIETKGQRLRRCDIILRESFLTKAVDFASPIKGSDHPYCEFMTGYIQGVLQKVMNDELTVNHMPFATDQGRQGARSESCLFKITPRIHKDQADLTC